MDAKLVALSVPFFLLLMALELFLAWRKGLKVYRLVDAIADLGCGIAEQITLVLFGAGIALGYGYVYAHGRLTELHGGLAWAVGILGVDLMYYWWHRASHRVNALWAVHVVHHQSEDYNYAVALRQAVLSPFSSLPFYLPLAVLGVEPLVFMGAVTIDTLYQFWVHTELVGPLPAPIEFLFNTASHHRVHHAVNAHYLDRNYGGIFIVFDRLFGTFVKEEEKCTFGTVKPLFSFNALYAQVAEFGVVASKVRGASLWDKVRVWWMPPEWLPSGPATVPAPPTEKFEPKGSAELFAYVAGQFLLLVALTPVLMYFVDRLPHSTVVALSVAVFAGLLSLGGLVDGRAWAPGLELARVVLSGALLAAWGVRSVGVPWLAAALVFTGGSVAWFLRSWWRRQPVPHLP
jgi:sterol desaturase/sphingolipid hydroxylase (fatty acid hydroxylase superfamily)